MTTAIVSNHFKYALATQLIDLSSDSIKVLLMKSGYVFNKDTVSAFKNIRANSSSQTLTVEADDDTITGDGGDFLTAGFIVGNIITTDLPGNPGPYTITNVTANVITVSEALVDEGPTGGKTVSSDDELETGNGYTQNTKTLAGISVIEDDTDDRAELTCDDIGWTASGGSIGPTPGAIMYDDTSLDDTVMGYIDFEAEETATDGNDFEITNITLYIS